MKGLIRTALGLALVLGWWTLRGGSVDTETASGIPDRVWDGGAGVVTIEVETSTAADVRVNFDENGDDESARSLATHQEIPPGRHAFSIDVPADVGGYVELGAIAPEPGDTLSWTISVAGAVVDEQSDALEKPLEDGYAFFIQAFFDDFAKGELGVD